MSLRKSAQGLARGPIAALAFSLAVSALGASACRCDGGTRVLQAFPEKYAGVGLELAVRGEHPHVVRAIEGAAAAAAGLRAGDVVVKIDGLSTKHLSLADAVAALRGEHGSEVSLSIRRGGGAAETFVLLRGLLARPGAGADGSTLDGRSYQQSR